MREHHHDHKHTHAHVEVLQPCDGAGHEHHHHPDGSCCCEHHLEEFHGIERPMLARLIVAAICYLTGMLAPVGEIFEAVLMIAAAVLAGYDIVIAAVKNLAKKRLFDEYFLMCFAAIAAFIIGEFEEGAAVFLLYRIGAFCQSYAIRHSQRTIASITGENHRVDQADKPQNAFITRFAQIYTPVILALAILIAIFMPVFTDTPVKDAVYRVLSFLVLACPCAIVISVPLAYFAGIAAGSRMGIFFHDAHALDRIAKADPKHLELHHVAIKYKTAYIYSASGKDDYNSAELVMTGEQSTQQAVALASHTRIIAHENVWFTIIIKLAVLILSAFGVSALWFAVFADSGVTVITVLNALRAFRVKKQRAKE